jgi:proteasome lid subunit RPN8/RPN11
MPTLVLAPGVAQAILDHAQAGYPEEVCGIIGGPPGRGEQLFRGSNVAAAPRVAFEIDVATLARQIDLADAGLDLTAIYHSHPQGPEWPSASDVSGAYYPSAVYLICSLRDPAHPVLRGYRIADRCVQEVTIEAGQA